jgi:hypothetical protein
LTTVPPLLSKSGSRDREAANLYPLALTRNPVALTRNPVALTRNPVALTKNPVALTRNMMYPGNCTGK